MVEIIQFPYLKKEREREKKNNKKTNIQSPGQLDQNPCHSISCLAASLLPADLSPQLVSRPHSPAGLLWLLPATLQVSLCKCCNSLSCTTRSGEYSPWALRLRPSFPPHYESSHLGRDPSSQGSGGLAGIMTRRALLILSRPWLGFVLGYGVSSPS